MYDVRLDKERKVAETDVNSSDKEIVSRVFVRVAVANREAVNHNSACQKVRFRSLQEKPYLMLRHSLISKMAAACVQKR